MHNEMLISKCPENTKPSKQRFCNPVCGLSNMLQKQASPTEKNGAVHTEYYLLYNFLDPCPSFKKPVVLFNLLI